MTKAALVISKVHIISRYFNTQFMCATVRTQNNNIILGHLLLEALHGTSVSRWDIHSLASSTHSFIHSVSKYSLIQTDFLNTKLVLEKRLQPKKEEELRITLRIFYFQYFIAYIIKEAKSAAGLASSVSSATGLLVSGISMALEEHAI